MSASPRGSSEAIGLPPIFGPGRLEYRRWRHEAVRDWLWDLGDRAYDQLNTTAKSLAYRARLGLKDRRGGARRIAATAKGTLKGLAGTWAGEVEFKKERLVAASLLHLLWAVAAFAVGSVVGGLGLRPFAPILFPSTTFVTRAFTVWAGLVPCADAKLLGPNDLLRLSSASLLIGGVFGATGGASVVDLFALPLGQLAAFTVLSRLLHPVAWSMVGSGLGLGGMVLLGGNFGLARVALAAGEALVFDARHRASLHDDYGNSGPALAKGLFATRALAGLLSSVFLA